MTTLHAQPYDVSGTGFYFDSVEKYDLKLQQLRKYLGQSCEEFEIQFIDGENIDCELFSALGIHQGNFAAYLQAIEDWSEDEKIKVIIAVGEAGYSFDLGKDDPNQFEIHLYQVDSLKELAYQFVEEGLFGEIPVSIQNYLDYNAIARDLGMDYSEIVIDKVRYIYYCR